VASFDAATSDLKPFANEVSDRGFAMIRSGLDPSAIGSWIERLDAVLEDSDAAIRNRKGVVYAARNVIDELPDANAIWQTERIKSHLAEILGPEFVLVRALYFDKHPDRTWSLPWHKDMTIAVKDNSIPSDSFSKPTRKLNVPHVEASTQILQNMLTLRFHLDAVTEDNGPLEVIPKSHQNGKLASGSDQPIEKILADAGDVLAMRPLLSHASGNSTEGTQLHRRILHFEFSGDAVLPDGYQWYYTIA
jgi:hypothetical protein